MYKKISEYIKYLKLNELLTSVLDLAIPTYKLIISPYYMIEGYVSYYRSCIQNNKISIVIGSTVIIGGCITVYIKKEEILPYINTSFLKNITQYVSFPFLLKN